MLLPPSTQCGPPQFPGADRLGPRELAELERRLVRFAAGAARALLPSGWSCRPTNAQIPAGPAWRFGAWLASGQPLGDATAETAPSEGASISICVDAALAERLVNALLGHPEAPLQEDLRALDLAVLSDWLRLFAGGVFLALAGDSGESRLLQEAAASLESPEWAEAPDPRPDCLSLSFYLEYREHTGAVWCRLPRGVAGGLLRTVEPGWAGAWRRQLMRVRVGVEARFPPVHLPLSELLQLQAGDVIVLSPEANLGPQRLCLGRQALGTGKTGAIGGRLAFQISSLGPESASVFAELPPVRAGAEAPELLP